MKRTTILAALLVCACLITNAHSSHAQGRQIVKMGGRLIRSLAEKAIVSVTMAELSGYFSETPANRTPVQVSISNNYRTDAYVALYDGIRWHEYTLSPGYYVQVGSNYQGAVAVYYGGAYYLIGTSSAYQLSNF